MNAYTGIPRVLSGCEDGDSAAIEALVHAFSPSEYLFARSILHDPAEADEATPDS